MSEEYQPALSTTPMTSVHLSDQVCTPSSIEEFVEGYIGNLSNKKVSISGDSGIGTLSLSGNLHVGNETSSFAENCVATGDGSIAGMNAFMILDADLFENTFILSSDLTRWRERLEQLL